MRNWENLDKKEILEELIMQKKRNQLLESRLLKVEEEKLDLQKKLDDTLFMYQTKLLNPVHHYR